jgi:hypothetical protein
LVSIAVEISEVQGRFHRSAAWLAPDLTFRSAGIETVDLDRDGKRDVLYTGADAFDNNLAKPWRGVRRNATPAGSHFVRLQ